MLGCQLQLQLLLLSHVVLTHHDSQFTVQRVLQHHHMTLQSKLIISLVITCVLSEGLQQFKKAVWLHKLAILIDTALPTEEPYAGCTVQ